MMNYFATAKTDNIYVSARFHQVVTLHVLKNMLKKAKVQSPLLLGIHGPSGEGKTFQCEHVLRKMGVKRFVISGGQLESSLSGEPARLLRSVYIKASDSIIGGECSMAVLLFNDIDTGLGTWGEGSKYSTNQITLYGELMHLVDYPNSVDGRDTRRIPIILTGNDFTKLYGPLVRAGRMTSFEWIPTQEERSEIIHSIFPELSLEECRRLVQELGQKTHNGYSGPVKELTIAFYAHLRSTLLDEDLWAVVEQSSLPRTVDRLVKGDEPDLSLGIHYDRVLAKGLELAGTSVLLNHFNR